MKDLRLLQTKKSPRKEMTSLYQRMLTFMVRATGLEPAHRLTLEPNGYETLRKLLFAMAIKYLYCYFLDT